MGIVADENKTQESPSLSPNPSAKRLPLAEEGIMETLLLPFSPRFIVLTICAVVTALLTGIGFADGKIFDILLIPILIFGALTALGVRDLMQKGHAVLRNYPISAHIRFLLEEIRPEMRQYFFESEKDGMPFSRDIRAVVYQRAKMQLDKRPFGTQEDVYRQGYEWMHHSVSPKTHAEEKFRVTIGGPDCAKPYSASVFNISAMSFGALSPNAVRALNAGAKKGGFAHDTGEGGFSPYHAEMGGDIIWEIGSGYFGCRHLDGTFDPEAFARVARQDQIKMVELKISQGAKPGHGGVLPAAKVSEEISKIRGVAMGEDCISPASHRAFSTPVGMMQFIGEMRKLSGGKPTGFKLCIGHPWEFLAICKAMIETGIYPDFIVVDGNEGGTGAAPLEFMDHLGMPMREGVSFVHNALIGINARDRIKIGASGKIATAFDMARAMSIGADYCNSARGFMFSLGCIQSLSCHTDRCPTGVATQDPTRARALYVPLKIDRVHNYHLATLHSLTELVAAAGLEHPQQLRPIHFSQRTSTTDVKSFAQLYPSLRPGELLEGTEDARFRDAWRMARTETFQPAP
ncbi:FMN-binding glutamate synthase family protein [Bradyrhizobium sp. 40]|uniref:FMN-binding glutamate synthase family protein n=1 Tax=unclassified Bradyrhizobium TaxID=2631580 RepID=UPI001FFC0706|nr:MULTISPECIES: FMN-binding glutamate synthase family protein [unclassified Bradyrhizobium]MCK1398206.1 FMN-binding glutamate synthase family protein [Bradyrhizobium sp. 39]MCK1750142.1 FMN-binding glutamate synthase family protein [Bradyrhizobium sp. 135]UPJ34990.1 FMN-binding glutamate synthase family protein [Bradyrhizobium sp. 4]UPJ42044.1 FMN-binding glutamate synthase family protein [Bradyrhizobium sp. 40]